MEYKHIDIEAKWQKYWADNNTFRTGTDKTKPKFYALDMFPYPSGEQVFMWDTLKVIQQQIF